MLARAVSALLGTTMTGHGAQLDDVVRTTWDAIVIGAGPAGALAARQIAGSGARVLLVERRAFPRWKVCGACLNGRGLAVLDAVGLGDFAARLGAVPLDTFDLRHRGRSATLALPAGVALSRASMDSGLVDEARKAGVRVLNETRATVLRVEHDVRRVELVQDHRTSIASARVVVVAAGLGQHCVSDEPGLKTEAVAGSRMGAGCVVDDARDGFEPGTLAMAVGRHGYVGLVRVEDGRLNVAAAFERDWLRGLGSPGAAAAAVLAEAGFPGVPGLESAPWQGTVGLTRRVRIAGSERLFLIGDAVGYVEPFTGEGMAWALASGQAVAPLAMEGIAAWEPTLPRRWTTLHGRLIGRRQRLCRIVAGILRRPLPARLAFGVLCRNPWVARPFLKQMNSARVSRNPECVDLAATILD